MVNYVVKVVFGQIFRKPKPLQRCTVKGNVRQTAPQSAPTGLCSQMPRAANRATPRFEYLITSRSFPTLSSISHFFVFVKYLLAVKIINSAIGVEVRSEIAVCGDYNKFVGALYVVNVVAVLGFGLV